MGLDLFHELVAFPALLAHPNFRIELVLIREEEVRGPVPEGARFRHPRQWWRLDRRLVEVVETIRIDGPADLAGLLPPGLPETFTSADIAAASRRPRGLAMRTAYCLTRAGAATCTGRRGRLQTYRLAGGPPQTELMRAAEAAPPLECARRITAELRGAAARGAAAEALNQ